MKCTDLAGQIEHLRPDASPRDVARLCLLLSNAFPNLDDLTQHEALTEAWKDVDLRLQAATDQHAAMTEELESLARSEPRRFTADQVWTLIRVIKVQGQVLQMYVGQPALSI